MKGQTKMLASALVRVIGLGALLASPHLMAAAGESVYFQAERGHKIHGRLFVAEEPRAQLLVISGLQSHSAWFMSAEFLAESGINVLALDRTGRSLSGGRISKAEDFYADLVDGYKFLEQLKPGVPIHVHANCFGSRSVIPFINRNPKMFRSAIITAPATAMEPRADYSKVDRACILFYSKAGSWPSGCQHLRGSNDYLVRSPLRTEYFSTSEEGRTWIDADFLSQREFSVDFLMAANQVSNDMEAAVRSYYDPLLGDWTQPSITTPTMVVLGEQDQMVDNRAIERDFFPVLKGRKQLVKLQCEHALEFCPQAELQHYRQAMKNWILGSQ